MDALALGRLDCLCAAVDVLEGRAREAADDSFLRALSDLVHGRKITFGGNRESGLDDVHTHIVEQFGDFELFFVRHGRAWTLLAVTQRSVEYDDAVLVGLCL